MPPGIGYTYPPEVERWRPLVARYFPPEAVDKALWTLMHESSGNPGIDNPDGSGNGLFQINVAAHGQGNWHDPETNVAKAAELYRQSGWAPWGGDGNTYNGQVFGALGNNPYPGDTQGGQAMPEGQGYVLPVAGGQVTAVFGPTSEQLDGGYMGYDHFNKGLDIGVPVGTPVQAVVGGTVVQAGADSSGWGYRVVIRDAQGNMHSYGHLAGSDLTVGEQVGQGQQIALSGNTGVGTGAHLSYDVADANGQYIDPSPFLGFNAAGDQRNGHPLLGTDVSTLAGRGGLGDVPNPYGAGNQRTDALGFLPGGPQINPGAQGYQPTGDVDVDWLARWDQVNTEYGVLDARMRPWTDENGNLFDHLAFFDPNRGVVAWIPDGVDDFGKIITREEVVATPEEYTRWINLNTELIGLESEYQRRYGEESIADLIARSDYLYRTSPEVIDAENAAAEFTRRIDIRNQAAERSTAILNDQNDRLANAAETQAALTGSRGRPAHETLQPFGLARPKRIKTAAAIFNEQLAAAEADLPDVPDYPTAVPGRSAIESPPDIPGIDELRGRNTGAGGSTVTRPPDIPGTYTLDPGRQPTGFDTSNADPPPIGGPGWVGDYMDRARRGSGFDISPPPIPGERPGRWGGVDPIGRAQDVVTNRQQAGTSLIDPNKTRQSPPAVPGQALALPDLATWQGRARHLISGSIF